VQRIGLGASYIYHIEIGNRRPSREVTLALAEALGIEGEDMNKLPVAADHTPMPILTMLRGPCARGAESAVRVQRQTTFLAGMLLVGQMTGSGGTLGNDDLDVYCRRWKQLG